MKYTPKDAYQFLTVMVQDINNKPLRGICERVLGDDDFQQCWGGEKYHHTYDGGLMVHTAEVVLGCRGQHPIVPLEYNLVLLPAAIVHDYMKVRDYQRQGEIMVSSPYKKLIHHVQGSAMWMAAQMSGVVDQEVQDEILHCLLSHHGRKEWGSIIEPRSPEAMALHHADMMSMMFGEGR